MRTPWPPATSQSASTVSHRASLDGGVIPAGSRLTGRALSRAIQWRGLWPSCPRTGRLYSRIRRHARVHRRARDDGGYGRPLRCPACSTPANLVAPRPVGRFYVSRGPPS